MDVERVGIVCHSSSALGTAGLGVDTIDCFAGGVGVGFLAGGEGTVGLDLTDAVSFTTTGTVAAAAAAILAAVTLVSGTFGVTGLTSGTCLYHNS